MIDATATSTILLIAWSIERIIKYYRPVFLQKAIKKITKKN